VGSLRQRISESPYANKKDTPEMIYRFDMAKAKLYGFLDRPEAALRRYPAHDQSDPAHYGRSVAYFRSGEIDKAVGEIDALIAKDPTNPYFQELKGQILFEGGRITASIPFHRNAVKLAPFEPLLRVNLAQAIIANPGSEKDEAATLEAQSHLNKAVVYEKDLTFAYHQLAITYDRQGNAGMANLSTAERYFYIGDMDGAGNFAARARDKLTEDTIAWNRAMDILNVVKVRRDKKRGRSFTFDTTVSQEPLR
jgi:predicted Zn-dependent protease